MFCDLVIDPLFYPVWSWQFFWAVEERYFTQHVCGRWNYRGTASRAVYYAATAGRSCIGSLLMGGARVINAVSSSERAWLTGRHSFCLLVGHGPRRVPVPRRSAVGMGRCRNPNFDTLSISYEQVKPGLMSSARNHFDKLFIILGPMDRFQGYAPLARISKTKAHLFRTSNIEIVQDCRMFFKFQLLSEMLTLRYNKFISNQHAFASLHN